MKAAMPASLFLLPATGFCSESAGQSGGFSLLSSSLQMLAALAVVIGIILVFHSVSKRFLKIRSGGRNGLTNHIRVVENHFLAPKKSLLLVEVGGEYLLLGSCGDNVTLIKHIDMLEEIEVLGEAGELSFRTEFQERLRKASSWRAGAGIRGLADLIGKTLSQSRT